MKDRTITSEMLDLRLRQLKPTEIHALGSEMHIVKFNLDNGVVVSYVYNITLENKYYLQRMQPYAMPHGKFSDENEIIDFITGDIANFRNAAKSSNFPAFTRIAGSLSQLNEQFESLFIGHNLGPEDIQMIETKIDDLTKEMKTIKDRTQRITY